MLSGVDKFKPIFGGGEVGHSKEAIGRLVVSGGDSAIDLEAAEDTLDAIALPLERPIILDLLDRKVDTDLVGIIALGGKQRGRCALGQVDQPFTGLALRCFVTVRWKASGCSRVSARQCLIGKRAR